MCQSKTNPVRGEREQTTARAKEVENIEGVIADFNLVLAIQRLQFTPAVPRTGILAANEGDERQQKKFSHREAWRRSKFFS